MISFSGYAAAEANTAKTEKTGKKKSQSVGKRSADFFAGKSAVYNKSGLVKRKSKSRKSCPAFEL
jgi:hypothetical protein